MVLLALSVMPFVHASSGEKMLIIHIRTQFWGAVETEIGLAYASYGVAWGGFEGYIFATPVAYKMAGSTWHVHCTEYWWDSEPDEWPPVDQTPEDGVNTWTLEELAEYLAEYPPTMISGVDGIIDFEETPAKMVFNGQVKDATEPYMELVGRNVHFEGTFTWDPELFFVIEATLWIRPNK